MNKPIHLTTPLSAESMRKLRVNDVVTLTGTIYTARDMAHLKLRELKESGKPLPEALEGSVIFHAGPVVKKSDGGYDLLNIGPTTSIRMEPHSDFLGRLGVRAIVGKGGLGDGSMQAFKKYGMVYLLAAPGCGVLHAQAVKQVMRVHWLEEMGMPPRKARVVHGKLQLLHVDGTLLRPLPDHPRRHTKSSYGWTSLLVWRWPLNLDSEKRRTTVSPQEPMLFSPE
jgi:fumarate hydratase subunit beta/L(+)-tartrate dehydratase beta subunit